MIKRLLLLTGGLFALPFSAAHTENITEQLYTDNCVSCHAQMTAGTGEVLYTRNTRLATNKAELLQILTNHRQDLALNWDQETLSDMHEYLNTRYYQFEPSPK